VEAGVMVQAFENAMYELSMEVPISEPIQTGFGWHVINLQEIKESVGMSFEEASMTLVREYAEDAAARAFLEQADRLVDLVYEDPTTLESAALVLGLPVEVAGPFTRAGGEGITANPELIEAAYSDLVLLQGSVSDPINLDENRLVMIRLREHLPAAPKALQEVRDEIVATLAGNLARDNANARAMEILAALQDSGAELETLATDSGLEYVHHELVKRNAIEPDATLVQEVFRLQAPVGDESVKAVLPSSDGFAVVELDSVVAGELDAGSPFARQQYERIIANGNASLEAFALIRQLRATAEVEVFEERIQ
jgi:peptidyl-prolyl cis-trans isomerase D